MKLIKENDHLELVHEKGNWILLRDLGFSPIQTVVAAVAACSGYVYQEILEKQKIKFTIISIHADYERSTQKRSHPLSKIEIQFEIQVDKNDQVKAKKDLGLISRNCPVAQSLDPSIEVIESVQFVKIRGEI